jgi:hypothetical protein
MVAPGQAGLALAMVGAEGLYLLMAVPNIGHMVIFFRQRRRRSPAAQDEFCEDG